MGEILIDNDLLMRPATPMCADLAPVEWRALVSTEERLTFEKFLKRDSAETWYSNGARCDAWSFDKCVGRDDWILRARPIYLENSAVIFGNLDISKK